MKKNNICLLVILAFVLVATPLILAGTSDTHTVSLGITGSNNPVIDLVDTIAAQDVTPGLIKEITFTFTVTDADGYLNLDNSTAIAIFNKTGETDRSNTSCSPTNVDWNTNNYTCSIDMQFYDASGVWTINVSISDADSNFIGDNTTTFTYNTGLHMNMTPAAINFGTTLDVGQQDVASTDDPIVIQNIGNLNITEVNVTAYDLVGETYSSYTIGAGTFSVNVTDSAQGTALSDSAQVTVPDTTIDRGAATTSNTHFYVDIPSTDMQVQTYSTTGGTDWTVGVYGTSS